MFVYVLRLANNKFFVGSTYNITFTFKYIFKNNNKDNIFNKHKPLYVEHIFENCNDNDEYKYLVKYIRKYGVNNIYGPTMDSFVMERESIREIIEKLKD
jgi:hypothetical protein